ncbi:hypothetical protein [Bdellovibrio sp. HCB209]|uniref:hypothetical protein n=1 Tax=Bdellovibrio sp. HCB209 TaxID=3394354 RepID=UPI0039B6CF56
MKFLILSISLLMTLNNAAQAATTVVKGDSARTLMEALAGAKFHVSNMDADQWDGSILSVTTQAIICRYSAVTAPDELMSEVECISANDNMVRPNSLALAKAIAAFADFEGAAGSRYLSVNYISCSLKYSEREYQCVLDIDGLAKE